MLAQLVETKYNNYEEKNPFSLFVFLPAQVPDNDEQFVPDFQSENCKCDLFSFTMALKCTKL